MKPKTRANSTGTAYKRSRTWTVEVVVGYRLENGRPLRRTKGGFATKTAALAYAPFLKTQKPEKAVPTLDHYWDVWSDSALLKLSKSKQTAYRIAWSKLDALSQYSMQDIDVATLQGLINEKTPTYYPARDVRTLLSHLYRLAIADGAVTIDLPNYLTLPSLEEDEPEPFTEQELTSFWEHYEAGDSFIGYILLMVYTGMMPGELCILKKSMIDSERKEIIGCGLKTKERKKKPIVLADFILPVLADLCDQTPGEKVLRMNRDNFYEAFHAALARCGARDLTPYACRHTTATALALGNQVAPSVIQRVMRHKKFETTQRYIHPDDTAALNAVNTLR